MPARTDDERLDRPEDACLPAVLPVDAARFRCADPRQASRLAAAGAEMVASNPDVDLAHPGAIRGDGHVTAVIVNAQRWETDGASRWQDVVRRVAAATRLRIGVSALRRELHGAGYPTVTVVCWDLGHPFPLPGRSRLQHARRSQRLPRRAVVVGSRDEQRVGLDAALVAAGDAVGRDLVPERIEARTGVLVVLTEHAVVRVAFGTRDRIDRHGHVLDALVRTGMPDHAVRLLPLHLASGRAGLVEWSAERRMPGTRPPKAAVHDLLEPITEFLGVLHERQQPASGDDEFERAARLVADACPDVATPVRALGEGLDRELADLPRCFGHGDFWHGNLLREDGALSGVIDWDAARVDHVPLLDLMHLQVNAARTSGSLRWGPAVTSVLLPWAEAGGGRSSRDLANRVGIETDPGLLGRLVRAYWLTYLGDQLRGYPNRRERPLWLTQNIRRPLAVFAGS